MYLVKTILVPVDFSDLSRAAISAAIQLGAQNASPQTRIIALHVRKNLDKELQHQIVENPDDETLAEDIAREEKALLDAVELEYTRASEGGRDLARVAVQGMVTGGKWVDVALQVIEDEEVDVIVSATHGGPSGVRGWLFGSDTERLVHHSTCSVWVVKPKGFPYLKN